MNVVCYLDFVECLYSSKPEPFQVNLTAACNFGCECRMTDVEPVCGNNGLTYFSPCHAGCTAFSSRSNYTNCACMYFNIIPLFIWMRNLVYLIEEWTQIEYSEVLTTLNMTSCGVVEEFCRICYLCLESTKWRWRQQVSTKQW